MLIIAIFTFFIVLLLLQEFFRRHKWASWITFLILPVVLLPWWIVHANHSVFGWIKVYSVAFGMSWIMALRFTAVRDKSWAFVIMYLVLAVNIFEAIMQDIVGGHYLNYMNAITGVILIATLPGIRAISVNRESRYNDLQWDIPLMWIVGYSIWNLMFIHLFVPEHTGMHVAVIGSALTVGLINRKLWLQARGLTLAIFAIMLFTYQPPILTMLTPAEINEPLALVGVTIALGVMIVHSVNVFVRPRVKSVSIAQL